MNAYASGHRDDILQKRYAHLVNWERRKFHCTQEVCIAASARIAWIAATFRVQGILRPPV